MKTPTRLLTMRTMWEPLISISVEVIMKSVDVHNAYTIIECIYRANEEDGVYELFPDWYDALVKAKETLEKYENNRMGKVYIEYADYLLDTMPVLELKPLVLN